jgi:hypothetical protein
MASESVWKRRDTYLGSEAMWSLSEYFIFKITTAKLQPHQSSRTMAIGIIELELTHLFGLCSRNQPKGLKGKQSNIQRKEKCPAPLHNFDLPPQRFNRRKVLMERIDSGVPRNIIASVND